MPENLKSLDTSSKVRDLEKAQDEKFRLMVENIKDYAIFMLDSEGRVESWNEGAKKLKGYEAHEIIGQHFSKFYPENDIRAKKPSMELEVARATGRFEDEGWRIKKDGSRFWANVVITALFGRDQKLIGFSKVTRDLTERKNAEENLKSAYEGLEVRVKEKTSQLEEALRSRDEFLSIASHELKTPVTSIKMQIQMAAHRITTADKEKFDFEKLSKTLEIASAQVERLTKLIDDLLDVARIQAGKLSYNFEKLNFSVLLREVLEGFSHQFGLSRSEVKIFVDEELEGFWDRLRIEQVMVNLVSNATKYAPGAPIFIYAKQEVDKAIISVRDLGPGIKNEMQNRVFERFERLGQSRNIGGLGLGLYISRQVINAHGGTIELKKFEEKGTTFEIVLPLDARSAKSVVKKYEKAPLNVFH